MSIKGFKKFLGLFGKFDALMKSLKDVKKGTISMTCYAYDGSTTEMSYKFNLSHATDDVVLEEDVMYEPVPEGIGAAEIKHEIAAIRARMYAYCLRVESQEYWDDLLRELPKRMQKDSARDLELSNIGFRAASQYGFDAHLYLVILAEAFCMDAIKAVGENNLVQAWYCLGRAQWWSSADVLPENPKLEGQKKARNAANARSEKNFGWIRPEVLKSIESATPPGGWKNAYAAAAALEPHISDFIDRESKRLGATTNLKPENLQLTLYTWMRENPEIKAAFERTRNKATLR
jgi:hypothetical protein